MNTYIHMHLHFTVFHDLAGDLYRISLAVLGSCYWNLDPLWVPLWLEEEQLNWTELSRNKVNEWIDEGVGGEKGKRINS